MSSKNMIHREESVIVSGSGKTRDEAFARAMSSVQKEITRKVNGTVLRIEPLEVMLLEGKEIAATERFLFLFLKREVSTFTVKMEIKVSIAVVDVGNFQFDMVKKSSFIDKLLK